MFNFSETPSANTTGGLYLKANAIHDVTFEGITQEVIESKDKTQKFNTLKIKFKAVDGGAIFEDKTFEPNASDAERKDNAFGSKNPSAVDELMFKFNQLIAAVNPELDAKVKEKKPSLDSWAKLVEFLTKGLSKSVGKQTQIKLIADKNNYAVFPRFALAFNQKGDLYPRTSYIGSNLAFTAKELERIEAASTAAPTNMPNTVNDYSSAIAGDDDISGLGDLDLGI